MEILQAHQTKNRCYKRATPANHIGILVHSTGAVNRNLKRYVDAPDRLGVNTNGNHWNKERATKAVHAFIGLDKAGKVIVAEALPLDIACWGCGKAKKGSYNYNPVAHIQFEICQGSNKDSKYYWEAITVAEEYCAHLCRLYGWTADQITSHKEAHAAGYASNHGDPQSWMVHFHDTMDKFRARVQARLDGSIDTPIKKPVETPKAEGGKTVMIELTILKNQSKGNEVKTLQRLLTAMGYNCGKADGIFGQKTLTAVKTFQRAKGLNADGIVGKDTWNALLK